MRTTPTHRWIGSAAAAAALVALLAGAAAAQSGTTSRVRGSIERLDGADLVVAVPGFPARRLSLPPTARVAAVARAELADIKPGTYVGTAATPLPDGSQQALEVLIFPEALRGTGEGHRAWDLTPESTMTNATVSESQARVDGRTMTLTYKDGEKRILVPAGVPVVTLIPADRSDIKPGTRAVVTVATGGDGIAVVTSIVVGKDGVDPPM